MTEVAGYDRRQVRAVFERRFSARAMARSYEALYARAQAETTLPSTVRPAPAITTQQLA